MKDYIGALVLFTCIATGVLAVLPWVMKLFILYFEYVLGVMKS